MKLDFTVLWIDDQPKHIQSYQESLQLKIAPLGFQLEVVSARSIAEIADAVGSRDGHDGIDLVLVDYDLGNGGGGEVALEQVRKIFRYKEIIFYSATDVEKLRTLAYERSVDGVHFSTRFGLVQEAADVVRKLLGKVLDIDHMRGLVMAAASDIDDLVERSLVAVYGKLESSLRKEFVTDLHNQMTRKLQRWQQDLDQAMQIGDLESLLALKAMYSAADKLTSLRKRLELQAPSTDERNEKMKHYATNIVPRRNKLAHARLDRAGALPEGFTSEDMTALRLDYINHRKNFVEVAVLLDVNFD